MKKHNKVLIRVNILELKCTQIPLILMNLHKVKTSLSLSYPQLWPHQG